MRSQSVVVALVFFTACSSSSSSPASSDAAAIDADDGSVDAIVIDSALDDATSEGAAETGDYLPLDCKFAGDPKNCWRAFTAEIDDCLGNPAGASIVGNFNAAGTACVAPIGRSVAFAIPIDPKADVPARADRDFTISSKTKKACLHYVEQASVNGFVATGPFGDTLTFVAEGNTVTLTCPDGKSYRGDAVKVASFCAPDVFDGGVPQKQILGGATVRFKLVGEKDFAFNCAPP